MSVQTDPGQGMAPIVGLSLKEKVELTVVRHLDLKLGGSFCTCGHKYICHRECTMGYAERVQITKPFDDLACQFLHPVRLQREVALYFSQQDALRLAHQVAAVGQDLKSHDRANVWELPEAGDNRELIR